MNLPFKTGDFNVNVFDKEKAAFAPKRYAEQVDTQQTEPPDPFIDRLNRFSSRAFSALGSGFFLLITLIFMAWCTSSLAGWLF